MTVETSRNPGYAPFAQWSVPQAPVPQTVHNLPGTVAANSTVNTSLIKTDGYSLIAAGITLSQAGTMSIQRYLDDGGTQPQGALVTVPLIANSAANLDVLDGKPFASFMLNVTNAAAVTATVTGFALLLQASSANPTDTATDGSTILTTGGTAQTLFGGVVPVNGFGIYNPNASDYLWVSDSTSAVANGAGSIPIAPFGAYETPPGYRPSGVVSVIAASTGDKITAKRW